MGPGTVDTGDGPQLTCEIVNKAGGAVVPDVIYATQDPGYNQVTLQIALNVGSTVLAPGGIPDPVADPPAPGAGTAIYIELKALGLTSQAWRRLTFDSPGWSFRAFADQGVLGMTPKAAVRLVAGTADAIKIAIGGLAVPGPPPVPPSVQGWVLYYNIPGVAGQYSTFPVVIQDVPGREADLGHALAVSVSANGIVNTVPRVPAAQNQFELQFAGRAVDVKASDSTMFTVAFVYGRAGDQYGYGALTGVTEAKEFHVDAGDGTTGWQIIADRDASSPNWKLRPQGQLIGGADSVMTVNFSNVVTTYQPGPTVMMISYKNVPGYRDGSFTLVLEKIPHAVVRSLDVAPNPARFHDGTAAAKVRWKADSAQRLELTQDEQPSIVTGTTETPVTLDTQRTSFTLTATGRPGTVDNVHQATVQALALPVIKSFTGTPTEIYYGDQSHGVQLAWSVDSDRDVTLSSTAGSFDGQSFLPAGHASRSVSETQLVTLAPETVTAQPTLNRKLLISAFRPVWEWHHLPFVSVSVAAWPAGPFAVVAGQAMVLTVLDTVRYSVLGTVPLAHQAALLAFSADGTTLAVAAADGRVSVLTVTPGPASVPVFTAVATVSLGQPPKHLVVSPTGHRVYVTTDPGGGSPGQVVPLERTHGSYQAATAIDVGRAPCGLAFDATGSQLFVANSGDDSVTVVALDSAGMPAGTSTIPDVKGAPKWLAATPNGRQLLVSCAAAGAVTVIDPAHPRTGQRNVLPVGGTAGQVALLAGGAYAAVGVDTEAIALIDCGGAPDQARVVAPKAVTIADKPWWLTVLPDGLQLLVATNFGLSIMTLATYQASAVAPALPNKPTSVAVAPDGGSVFAWHDARLPASSPSPGVLVYRTGPRTVTNLLPSARVLGLVASPDPRDRLAFAITQGDPLLHVIATDTLSESGCPLGLAPGTLPVALAVAGDGHAVFVVTRDADRNLALLVLAPSGAAWRAGEAIPLYQQAASGGRTLLQAAPDGGTLFLADDPTGRVAVLRRAGHSYTLCPDVITTDTDTLDLAVLPDGSTAYVLSAGVQTNTVTAIDAAELATRVTAVFPHVSLTGLQPSPDGRRLYATDTNEGALRVLDPRSLHILQTIPLAPGTAAGAAGLAVFADGSAIVTANTVSQNLSIVEQVQLGTGPAAAQASPLPGQPEGSGGYGGLYLRHSFGDVPGAPRSAGNPRLASPDVIPYGPVPAQDPPVLTIKEGYGSDLSAPVALGGCTNYVYIRGKNPGSTTITARVYLFYVPRSLALWPANWRSDLIWAGGEPKNWVDVTAAPGAVVSGDPPFLWTPRYLDPRSGPADSYVLIAWVVDGRDPRPPDLTSLAKFATADDLARFAAARHDIAFFDTGNKGQAPGGMPDSQQVIPVRADAAGDEVALNVSFREVSPDGQFAVSVPGTSPANTVALFNTSLSDYPAGYSPPGGRLRFPPGHATSVAVSYWRGNGPLIDDAKITVTLSSGLPSLPGRRHRADTAQRDDDTLTAAAQPGIVVRQAATGAAGADFTRSPDLILTGTRPAMDPEALIDRAAYDWRFTVAPQPGGANYVYVRGVNDSGSGAGRARVYLYYARSDQLLNPAQWQQSGFSVAGRPQNWADLTAASEYQVVVTPPLQWVPPLPASPGLTYYLISWTDNVPDPRAPAWPATPFRDMAALGDYVRANPGMAILDTVYRGAFLRQQPGQAVTTAGTGARTSPDLIVSGGLAAKDAAQFTVPAAYAQADVAATAVLGQRNFVYVRAVNTAAGPATARVYLYWAIGPAVAPTGWLTTGFTVAGRPQNWVDVTAAAAGEIMLPALPVVWSAPFGAAHNLILIAYADNSGNPQPPDFTAFGYVTASAVARFVASHPELTWVDVTGQVVQAPAMSSEVPLAPEGTSLYVGLQLTGIPDDGTLSVSVPGPDAASTIAVPSTKVPAGDAFLAWPVTYPERFRTSAVISYTAGATPAGAASIVVTTTPRPSRGH